MFGEYNIEKGRVADSTGVGKSYQWWAISQIMNEWMNAWMNEFIFFPADNTIMDKCFSPVFKLQTEAYTSTLGLLADWLTDWEPGENFLLDKKKDSHKISIKQRG